MEYGVWRWEGGRVVDVVEVCYNEECILWAMATLRQSFSPVRFFVLIGQSL